MDTIEWVVWWNGFKWGSPFGMCIGLVFAGIVFWSQERQIRKLKEQVKKNP